MLRRNGVSRYIEYAIKTTDGFYVSVDRQVHDELCYASVLELSEATRFSKERAESFAEFGGFIAVPVDVYPDKLSDFKMAANTAKAATEYLRDILSMCQPAASPPAQHVQHAMNYAVQAQAAALLHAC